MLVLPCGLEPTHKPRNVIVNRAGVPRKTGSGTAFLASVRVGCLRLRRELLEATFRPCEKKPPWWGGPISINDKKSRPGGAAQFRSTMKC
jgi:hypothetical protein